MRTFVSFLFFATVFCTSAYAHTCEDGLTAYVAGDYAGAASILQPLAAQGDDCAQTQLGKMYLVGQGVQKNKAMARDLFKQAAAKGNRDAKMQAAMLEPAQSK